jgi:hypothetical protein
MAPVAARRPWTAQPRPAARRAIIRKTPAGAGAGKLTGAACAGQSAELFFGPDSDKREKPTERAKRTAAAIAVCASCPLRTRTTCLEQAQARGERFGVWGGVDFEASKRKPARPRRSASKPTRGVQAMNTAMRLGKLRGEHGSLRAVARAAELSPETARFYLTLLELTPDSQDSVRSGELTPAHAVAAIRSARRNRERAS